jgi:hypothetical protein
MICTIAESFLQKPCKIIRRWTLSLTFTKQSDKLFFMFPLLKPTVATTINMHAIAESFLQEMYKIFRNKLETEVYHDFDEKRFFENSSCWIPIWTWVFVDMSCCFSILRLFCLKKFLASTCINVRLWNQSTMHSCEKLCQQKKMARQSARGSSSLSQCDKLNVRWHKEDWHAKKYLVVLLIQYIQTDAAAINHANTRTNLNCSYLLYIQTDTKGRWIKCK